MAFWKKKKEEEAVETPVEEQKLDVDPQSVVPESLSELVIRAIREGVLIVDENKNIVLANPAAEELTGRTFDEMSGINYDSILNFLDKTGNRISEMRNPIAKAFTDGSYNEVRDLDLQSSEGRTTPVSVIVTPTQGEHPAYVVTLRNIARELEEERERNEFISTASHEMRTPVASIEGYLGLAMSPSTATVDERGMTYLTKAHEASKHLGKLFQDLLDTTKLDDGRIVPHFEPVEIVQLAKKIADEQIPRITAKGLGYQFGSGSVDQQLSGGKRIDQVIYARVDPSVFK
jgi:PAS domain S-box-containing protein